VEYCEWQQLVTGPIQPNVATPGQRGWAWWRAELKAVARAVPRKGVFCVLLAGWVALFHCAGNSVLGYVNTPSLFGWWLWGYTGGWAKALANPWAVLGSEESVALFVPWVVPVLLWCQRRELLALPTRVWWPAVAGLVAALGLHVLGYLVQQTRISLLAFFGGLYAMVAWVWGPRWARAVFFPFLLFGLCMPLGSQAERITFPLRLFATTITAAVAEVGLGIPVIREGTRLLDASGSYQYEVAAACSGIRSLTVTLALAIAYGFLSLRSAWRRWVMVASAIPLAVAANVVRLLLIIVAAEAFGQRAGNYVHQNDWLSLIPYVPAVLGIVLIGRWLAERRQPGVGSPSLGPAAASSKPSPSESTV